MSFINTTDFLYNDNKISDDDYTELICPDSVQPFLFLFLIPIIYALVCIIGLLGNSLVIYVGILSSKMKTVTNMYIVNLAIADECFLIGIPFLIVTIYKQEWIFGNTMCKLYMISTFINQFASSIFLVIMSADRYIAVCHPFSSLKWRTPSISRFVSLIAWTVSFLFVIPVVIYSHTFPINPNSKSSALTCNLKWAENESGPGQTTFTIYSLIFGFIIPLFIIIVFYCFVILKLRTLPLNNKLKEEQISRRKDTILILTVIIVYVLCWLPFWIVQVNLISTPPENCPSSIIITLYLLANCLSYSNSAMNPILYAFLNKNFQKSFVEAFTCATSEHINVTSSTENTEFPRNKTTSERIRPSQEISVCSERGYDDECEIGPLVSKADSSIITMTYRQDRHSSKGGPEEQ